MRLTSAVAGIPTQRLEFVLLESPTASLNFFQMLPHPRRNTVAFIETKWLRLITFFVVHFRASAEGITKVWCDITVTQLKHNHRRMSVSTWIGWRSILMLQGSGYDEALPDIQFAFSHEAHKAIVRQWIALEGLLRRRHLDLHASLHLRNRHRHLVFWF